MSREERLRNNINNEDHYLITCGVLAAVGLVLFLLRMYSKLRPEPHLIAADYFIAVATVLSFSGYASGFGSVSYGLGHRTGSVSESDRTVALKLLFAVQVQYVLSVCLVRMSVALSLLRLSINTLWKTTLWGLIFIQFLFSTGWIIVVFAWCRPVRSFWEHVENKQCWDADTYITFAWITSASYVLMDLAFALMPIKLVWRLRRPVREKILIGCLMGTGLIATGAAAARVITFDTFDTQDVLADGVYTTFPAKLEEQLGIIAACIPCLKVPAERFLRRLGVLSERANSVTVPSFITKKNLRYSSANGNIDVEGDGNETHPLSPIHRTHSSRSPSFGNHDEEEGRQLSLSNNSAHYEINGMDGGTTSPIQLENYTPTRAHSRRLKQSSRSKDATDTSFTAAAVNTTAPLPPLEEPTSNETPDGTGRSGRGRGKSVLERVGWEAV